MASSKPTGKRRMSANYKASNKGTPTRTRPSPVKSTLVFDECEGCHGTVRYSPGTGQFFHQNGHPATETIARRTTQCGDDCVTTTTFNTPTRHCACPDCHNGLPGVPADLIPRPRKKAS